MPSLRLHHKASLAPDAVRCVSPLALLLLVTFNFQLSLLRAQDSLANPALDAARLRIRALAQRLPQAEQWPDPTLSASFAPLPIETRLGPQWARVGLTQGIPWPGLIPAKVTVAQGQQGEARAQLTLLTRQQQRDRQQLLTEGYRLRRLQAIQQQELAWLDQIEDLILTLIESGKASSADLLRLRMQQTQFRNQLADLQSDLAPVQTRYAYLVGRDPGEALPRLDTLPAPRPVDLAAPSDQHPELVLLDQQACVLAAQEQLAAQQGKPALGVGLEYGLIGPRRDANVEGSGRDVLMVMASLRLPLGRASYAAAEQEQVLLQQAKQAEQARQEQALTERATSTQAQLQRLRRDWQLAAELAAQARDLRSLLLTQYSTGKAPFEELLRIETELLRYERQRVEALAGWHQAWAEWQYLQ